MRTWLPFTSRLGELKSVQCDNGTNLVGDGWILDKALQQRIIWYDNLHYEGLFEDTVGSFKPYVKKMS